MTEPCENCGLRHRFQFPDGSDQDGHLGSLTACENAQMEFFQRKGKGWGAVCIHDEGNGCGGPFGECEEMAVEREEMQGL